MTKLDKNDIEFLLNKTSITTAEVKILQRLIKTYIDPKCWICDTCPAQIRYAWVRLKEWWSEQNVEYYQFIKKI
jgi:hypothetical protein